MTRTLAAIVLVSMFLAGCASVPMESPARATRAKEFTPPTNGNAGLYIYRAGHFGGALTKGVWVDGECIGRTAPNVFFYHEVAGGQSHKITTESEFSPNDLVIDTEPGALYFIRQYIKLGVFVGGAGLELVDAGEGKREVSELKMAARGTCNNDQENVE